jgi:cbb3-type cytochrome oxidase cytochrome c subunit
MIVAVDAGVRLTKCYSSINRRIETVGVAVVAVVSDTGLVDVTPPIYTATPETREYEVEIARHFADKAEICVLDGIPEKTCKRNLGVVKTGNTIRGWICRQWGPYALCGDFAIDEEVTKTAIKLNNIAHNIAHRYAKLWFEYELLKRRCITAEGVHVIPDLSYYSK